MIDPDRLERRTAELSRIAGRGTSVSRLGLSAEEQQGRELVRGWLAAEGAKVRRDAAANLFARFGGQGEAVLVGSHLDSVPEGGRFDGALGVLCAVEAVVSLTEAKIKLQRPIEVVAWADEEGARFGVGLFGSTAAFGRLARGVGDRTDRDGISIAEALRALGEQGDPAAARRDPKEIAAYLELHIEQGPRLETAGLPLGIVSDIVGIYHARVAIRGRADHARVPVTPLDPKIRDVLKRATTSVGVEAPLLVSGAGHDAQNPALSGVPTGMIFVRSTGGSHTPREFASIEDAALGAQALANAIKELAT